jgi:hypothetical protein
MPNVTTQYKMFVPRRRRIGGGGSTIDLVPAAVNAVSGDAHATAPDTIDVHYPNPQAPSAPANFAFWSVIGSADGEYTDRPGTPGNFLSVHTASGPVTMTAWYVFAGGGNGNGRPELETDAFLVDENAFVDPTPIESVTPADAWDHSDVNEFVFTSDESSDVLALDSVVDANEHFEVWYALEGGSTPAGRTLQVPKDDNGIAVATYRIPPPVHFLPPGTHEQEGGTIVGGVAHDGSGGIIINGIYHPIGPWDPFLAGLAVFAAAKALQPEARARVQTEAMRAIANEARLVQRNLQQTGVERVG